MFGLAETATLGAFLAQDLILFVLFFDLMLIPFYFLFGSWGTEHEGRPEEDEGPIRPQPATLKMFIYTLVGSLLMLAGAIATGILAADGGPINFNIQHLAADPLGTGSQYWIFWFFAAAFLVKMPALPAARLDARRLPGGAAAGAGPLLGRALQGRCLRLPADRATDLPGGDQPLPGGDPGDRGRLDPLRLGDGVHPDERAADPRLLVDGAARLHHPRHLQPADRWRRRVGPQHGQPRARRRSADADRGAARRAHRHRRHPQDGRTGAAGAGARGAVPDRDSRAVGDARLRQLHRRVLHPQRDLPGEDRLRLRRRDRHRAGRLLRAPPLPARDAQPQAGRDRIARGRPAPRRDSRRPGRLHRRAGALARADPEPGRRLGQRPAHPDGPGSDRRWPSDELQRPPHRLRGALARDRADRGVWSSF